MKIFVQHHKNTPIYELKNASIDGIIESRAHIPTIKHLLLLKKHATKEWELAYINKQLATEQEYAWQARSFTGKMYTRQRLLQYIRSLYIVYENDVIRWSDVIFSEETPDLLVLDDTVELYMYNVFLTDIRKTTLNAFNRLVRMSQCTN